MANQSSGIAAPLKRVLLVQESDSDARALQTLLHDDPTVGAVVVNYRDATGSYRPAGLPDMPPPPEEGLVSRTLAELRTGRIGWRVRLLLGLPALAAGVIAGL